MKSKLLLVFATCLQLMQGVHAAAPKENVLHGVHAAAPKETQRDVANRIAIDGERAANRGDAKGEKDAESASNKARRAKTVEEARQIEKTYNKDNFN